MKHIICINCYHFCGKELCHIPRSFQDFADSMTYLVFNFFIFNACEVPLPSRAGKCTEPYASSRPGIPMIPQDPWEKTSTENV